MPTVRELLEAKLKRLDSVPAKFESELTRVQKQVLEEIIVILGSFDVDEDGFLEINQKNVRLAGEMDVLLRSALDRSDYNEAVTEFAKQFNVQIDANNAYFAAAFKGFEKSELGKQIVLQSQRTAVDLLINSSADINFITPIKQVVENAVINGAGYRETLSAIQDLTVGYTDERGEFKEGKILSHSKQIAHDTFAVADRSYSSAVAEELGAEWFNYAGAIIKTSRAFCIERHNRYFCKKEIEMWGEGKKTGYPGEFETPQAGSWAGEWIGTNARSIFSTAGGYNCQHDIIAVPIFSVPKKDIQRAIDLGYYKPTEYEVRELGLSI